MLCKDSRFYILQKYLSQKDLRTDLSAIEHCKLQKYLSGQILNR